MCATTPSFSISASVFVLLYAINVSFREAADLWIDRYLDGLCFVAFNLLYSGPHSDTHVYVDPVNSCFISLIVLKTLLNPCDI